MHRHSLLCQVKRITLLFSPLLSSVPGPADANCGGLCDGKVSAPICYAPHQVADFRSRGVPPSSVGAYESWVLALGHMNHDGFSCNLLPTTRNPPQFASAGPGSEDRSGEKRGVMCITWERGDVSMPQRRQMWRSTRGG